MTAFESFVLLYLVNALWQLPLLAAAAWLAARALRRLRPAAEHRLWVAALLAQVILPACSIQPLSAALRPLLDDLAARLFRATPAPAHTGITVTLGPAVVRSGMPLSAAALHALVAIYCLLVLALAARLAFGLFKTLRLRARATPAQPTGALREPWLLCARHFHVPNAELALSPHIAGPITIGIRHRTVLLPAAWPTSLPAADLATAIAHEFAHMRRRDFATNLLYRALSLPIAFHPALWITRSRITETREMVCDQLAAAALSGPGHYARSLLRLASASVHGAPAPTLHAIGIFDANSFERRVMRLTRQPLELRGLRRNLAVTAALLLGAAACASALTLRLELASAAPATPAPRASAPRALSPQEEAKRVRVSPGVMAGQVVSKVAPVYPAEAREQGISGTVVLRAIINREGMVENLAVESGPEQLQNSAIDAVKHWVYKPFLLNGEPVEVETTINVNYSLAN